jgi:hypothetical protein
MHSAYKELLSFLPSNMEDPPNPDADPSDRRAPYGEVEKLNHDVKDVFNAVVDEGYFQSGTLRSEHSDRVRPDGGQGDGIVRTSPISRRVSRHRRLRKSQEVREVLRLFNIPMPPSKTYQLPAALAEWGGIKARAKSSTLTAKRRSRGSLSLRGRLRRGVRRHVVKTRQGDIVMAYPTARLRSWPDGPSI